MSDSILGTRIRQRRRDIGVTQADLARQVGISPSYLNLIEWNKRRIAGSLLRQIAAALKMPLDELDGAAERQLLDRLREIAHSPSLSTLGIEHGLANEMIGRFPGWARGIATLARSERIAAQRIEALSERLSNDPFLGETVHKMLTRIASIRSAVEILTDYTDLSEEHRNRFNKIVHDESRALTDVGEALALYLEKAEDHDKVLTPIDEVESLFAHSENRFPQIDDAAAKLTVYLSDPRPVSRTARAKELTEEYLAPLIDELVRNTDRIETEAAKSRAGRALRDYAIGAVLLPMRTFTNRSAELGYDVEALSDAFSVHVETICHRLTALPRNQDTPVFGYFRANAAGTIVEMLGLRDLSAPRYAAACPLWALYRAQQSPETVLRQRTLFPNGQRFVFIARARHIGPTGFGRSRHYVTDMLAIREEDAQFTVYAPEQSTPVDEVGPSCRLCPRTACLHRVEDPLSG